MTSGDDDAQKTQIERVEADLKDHQSLQSQRLAELINLVGDQIGRGHGWKARAASMLDISAAHLSRILAGHPVGRPTIDRVAESLGVPLFYFSDQNTDRAAQTLKLPRLQARIAELASSSETERERPPQSERTIALARQIMTAAGSGDDQEIRRLALQLAVTILE